MQDGHEEGSGALDAPAGPGPGDLLLHTPVSSLIFFLLNVGLFVESVIFILCGGRVCSTNDFSFSTLLFEIPLYLINYTVVWREDTLDLYSGVRRHFYFSRI